MIYSSLVSRVKSDEKLRTRIRDLEDAGNILSSQLESAIQLNKDLEDRLVKSDHSRSRDYSTVRKALEESRQSALKVRLMTEENEMLSMMNKELSIRVSKYEGCSVSPRLESAYNEERQRSQALTEEVSRLNSELVSVKSQVSRSTAVSPDPTPRKSTRRNDESLGSLVRSLKEMADSPLRAIKDSDADSDPSSARMSDKSPVGQLDNLSSRVQALEEERRSLQRKLKSAQAVLNGVGSATPDGERRGYWTPTKEQKPRSKANSPNKSVQMYDSRWL